MSGVFSDQAFVDRLIERVKTRFRFVDAWRLWFEKVEGLWRPENAEARLKDEYRLTVEEVREGDDISGTSRRKAINSMSQQAALWLLRNDQRIRSSPEDIQPWLKATGKYRNDRDTLSACAREYRALEIQGNTPEGAVSRFFIDALNHGSGKYAGACAKSIPNVLIRTDHKAPDPIRLLPAITPIFGERAIEVHWDYWRSFPYSLTPALALDMAGAQVVFLTGLESGFVRGKHFPQWSLSLLFARDQARWAGKEGIWHTLALPSHFILCGPPVQLTTWEYDLRPHLLMLTSLTKEASE